MSKPIPSPRRKSFNPEKTKDAEALKCSSPPQSPTSSKGDLVGSTPPPVPPKKWTVKKSPGGVDTVNGRVEIVKVMPNPPLLFAKPKQQPDDMVLKTQEKHEKNENKPPDSLQYVEAQPVLMPQRTPKEQPDIKNEILVVAQPVLMPQRTPKEQPDIKNKILVLPNPPPLFAKPPKQQPDDMVLKTQEKHEKNVMAKPPPSPVKSPKGPPETLDDNSLLAWWTDVIPWKYLCKDLKSRGKKERKIVKLQAEHLYKGIRVYTILLSQHGSFLKERTTELLCIADNLDKVSKNTKIAGITGGATTVAGGVAAAAGVILSPLTLGASLALSVIGVGMAAAGSVTGASAAIANKVNATQDKKKIEKTFQEYESHMEDIQRCLKFINEGMKELKQHDLSFLIDVMKDSVRIAKVIQFVTTGGGGARALEATSKASGVMKGFALGIGIHFTKEKDGQKLKRGHESKLAKKIRTLAVDVSEALDELMEMNDMFSKLFPEE